MILLLLALCACGGNGADEHELALDIRKEYQSMQACTGSMELVADYGERVYEYAMDFAWTQEGETVLTITEPAELSGMTARIAKGETALLFDDVQLETGPLSPDGLSPVDCFPKILHYILSGYIAECGTEALEEGDCLRVQYREPEVPSGSGLEAVLWFGVDDHALRRVELQSDGFTVIRAEITAWSATATAMETDTAILI